MPLELLSKFEIILLLKLLLDKKNTYKNTKTLANWLQINLELHL